MSEPNKYEYTAVKLPREKKRKVRKIAAEKETSIAEAALELLEIGLEAYERGERLQASTAEAIK